ncbi:PilZ domain-containing protein [Kangiella sp. TOML190]|uniref:PilZ domain-containing protein n=1 Tax=Kangiella sp. TOML190 TaxID=2931351 RepID=UPI002040FA55|nr:PilZ domain-containing protein [Kangiella sp. TOML190]
MTAGVATARTSAENSRRFTRVRIQLPVAIRQADAQVFLSETLDLSEGGILVRNNENAKLSVGDQVKVHIDGILGEEQSKMVLHEMTVVRIEEAIIALEFI